MLFGRDWLWEISLDWGGIHSIKNCRETHKDISVEEAMNKQVQRLLTKYKSVSDKSLGTLRGVKAQLILEDGAQPKFCRARNVPYAVKPDFEKELVRLQKNAYLQMEVEETSKQYLKINTHKGLFRYNRLPFGIKTALSIWQRNKPCKGSQTLR